MALSKRQQVMLGIGIGGLVLIVVGLFFRDWFTLKISADLATAMGGKRTSIGIDLRTISICQSGAPCVSVALSASQSSFATIAKVTFFGSIVFALGLAAGVVGPYVGIHMTPAYGKRVAVLGALMLVATLITAYVLGPDTGQLAAAAGSLTVSHGLGGLALGVGIGLGICALLQLGDNGPSEAFAAAEPVAARSARSSPSLAPPVQATHVAPAVSPAVSCAAATIALSETGLDTTFVDRNIGLVEWADVVGVVARQLPGSSPYHGAMFVDIISGPHATVRALPTTRITLLGGAELTGDGAERVRALIAAIRGFAPAAKLDAATRAVCEQGAPVRQLADAADLVAHDERLP
ncbi:hypothetical protein BH11MYX1_BH11MYX1_21210 [soil metagenome]